MRDYEDILRIEMKDTPISYLIDEETLKKLLKDILSNLFKLCFL